MTTKDDAWGYIYVGFIILNTVRCRFSKILTKHPPYFVGELWGVFVSLKFDLNSALVIAELNVISWQMWPRYNDTSLY